MKIGQFPTENSMSKSVKCHLDFVTEDDSGSVVVLIFLCDVGNYDHDI